jgi:uncharacterized protein YprB with RNaseH-like and TPR domain
MEETHFKQPRILLIDIETTPLLGYSWGVYEQNILKVLEYSQIMCFAWKWLNEKTTNVKSLFDCKGYKPNKINDKELINDLWNLLDEADIIIAQNGDAFDIKIINSRFVYHGLLSPSFYKTIDTLKVAKRYFRFMDNRLDSLSKYLGSGNKNHPGLNAWFDCLGGDEKAWKKMKSYNKNDVVLLEQIYLKLRPFMTNHPNLSLFDKSIDMSCPTCMSKNLIKRGYSTTKIGINQRYQCKDCGSWCTGKHKKLDKLH